MFLSYRYMRQIEYPIFCNQFGSSRNVMINSLHFSFRVLEYPAFKSSSSSSSNRHAQDNYVVKSSKIIHFRETAAIKWTYSRSFASDLFSLSPFLPRRDIAARRKKNEEDRKRRRNNARLRWPAFGSELYCPPFAAALFPHNRTGSKKRVRWWPVDTPENVMADLGWRERTMQGR